MSEHNRVRDTLSSLQASVADLKETQPRNLNRIFPGMEVVSVPGSYSSSPFYHIDSDFSKYDVSMSRSELGKLRSTVAGDALEHSMCSLLGKNPVRFLLGDEAILARRVRCASETVSSTILEDLCNAHLS